jgi:hypothetical protein
MAFTRKALKELGITEETLEKVMQLYGNSMKDYTPTSDIEDIVKTKVDAEVLAQVTAKLGDANIEELKTQAGKVTTLEAELAEAHNELISRDYQLKATTANVNPKFLKYVVSEVTSGMQEADKFEDSLKTYLEANPEFVVTTPAPSASGGIRQVTPPATKTEEKSYLDEKYKNNPFYKKE